MNDTLYDLTGNAQEWSHPAGDAVLERRIKELEAERDALSVMVTAAEAHIVELADSQRDEVKQFNLGYDAFFAGEPSDAAPHFEMDYDVWMCGWAWGKFVKEERIGGK